MAHMSYPFKKTSKTQFQKPTTASTRDTLHWNKLGSPALVKEFGAIDYLDFSPVEPYYFAATSSVRVQIYDPITKTVAKNISKFVEAAYGACFRSDGRLIAAGSEEAVVKLFDFQSKNTLRVFTGHTGPVHRTFFTKDQVKIASFSDDKSVCLWDIATEERIATFSEHTDYIRAGATSPITPEIILSGSYDHTVKMYDCRTNETVLTVNHGSPVESTLFLPSGGIFISAGDTEIKVWDIFNGGKLLANISQHHKTVTTLRLATNNSRLVSASLDRHLKIYDISTFKVVHNIDFPNAILSMAISKHDDILAVGMVDGVISIRKRESPVQTHETENKGLFKFAPDHVEKNVTTVDLVVSNKKNRVNGQRELKEDKLLRKMEFSKALAVVLRYEVDPETTIALIQELLRRKVLHAAMFGLTDRHVAALIKFLKRNIGVTRFTRTVIDATNVFIDVFEGQITSFSENTLVQYKYLQRVVNQEVELCKTISELEGAISMLLANTQTDTPTPVELNDVLTPSTKAQKEVIIDVCS